MLGGLDFLLTLRAVPRFWAAPIGVAQEAGIKQLYLEEARDCMSRDGERRWPRALWRGGKGSRLPGCARTATSGGVDCGLESVGGSRTMGSRLRGCPRWQALRRHPPDQNLKWKTLRPIHFNKPNSGLSQCLPATHMYHVCLSSVSSLLLPVPVPVTAIATVTAPNPPGLV